MPTSLFRSKQEAVEILSRGTDKMLSYVVQRGDSLWTIAMANNMTVEDLRKANPNIEGDLIREGDNLNPDRAGSLCNLAEPRNRNLYSVDPLFHAGHL